MAKIALVIDNNEFIRTLLTELLRWSSLDVVAAADGAEGLEMARRHRPDLIVSNFRMPKLNGLDVIKAVRADPDLEAIPIIIVTPDDHPETRALCLEAGACAYLIKGDPFEITRKVDELVAVM